MIADEQRPLAVQPVLGGGDPVAGRVHGRLLALDRRPVLFDPLLGLVGIK